MNSVSVFSEIRVMKKILYILLGLFLFSACNKQEKLKKEIAQLELEDAEGSTEGRTALAKAYFDYANTYPSDTLAETYLLKACGLYSVLEKHGDVVQVCSKFLSHYDQSPHYSRVQLYRAKSLFLSDQPDSAVVAYEQVRDRSALNGDDLHFLKKTYLKLVEKYPTEKRSVDYRIKASNLLAEAGSGEQAINLLLQVADSFSDSDFCPYALMRAADIAETRLADLDQAKALLERLINTYPESNFAADARIILDKKLLGLTDEEKFQRIVSESNTP